MSDFKQRLLANQQRLTQQLNVEEILSKLYVDRALSKHEYEALKSTISSHGMIKAADQLVLLLTKKDVSAYENFMSSLRNTGQTALAHALEESASISPGSKLSKRDLETLRGNMEILTEQINFSKVMKYLESNRAFWTSSKKNDVKSKPNSQKRTEAMLEHVTSGTYSQLTQLIEALQHVGQYDMIRKLPVGVNVPDTSGAKKEPESVLTQVTVNPAQGQNLSTASGKEVCKEIVRAINDSSTDVRKKLSLDYELRRLEATSISKQPLKFYLELAPKSYSCLEKIHSDIQNQHLALLIKQYSHVSDVRRPYQLQINLREDIAADGAQASDGASANPRRDGNPLVVYRKVVHEKIDIKEYTNYDLWISLRKQRGQIYKSPFELSDDDGVPLTHMCVDRGRLSLLSVFLHMGWWTMLSRKKVPSASASIFKSMNCLDVAEAKRSRKPVDEVKMYTEWEESLSSIMKSARSGDYTRVATLVANEGESIHYRDMNNGNALYWGVVSGDMTIFKELLNKGGLDPTMRTRKNETLLHIACLLGMADFIAELVKCNIDVNFEDTNRKTALDRVAENGDIDTLKAFMSVNIRPKSSFPVIAAFSGRKILLEHCLDTKLHEINAEDQYNRTPIMRAVEGNRSEIVQYLLAKGAQLDLLPTTNKNLLHIVAESGSAAIFNMLMPELKKPGLFDKFLKQRDRYNGVELCFLIRGRDKGRDAWHYVEVSRHRVPLFLKKTKSGNVDVAAFGTVVKSGWGINPEQETIDYIEELFKKRRLDTTAPADSTPLHIAIFKGNTDVAKLLLQHGADVNIKDKFGLTPLMLAAAKDNLELIQELERYGAKFSDVNVDGKNAAEVAYENENDTIINYIGGRDHYRLTENFLTSDVTRLKTDLSREKLDQLRTQGRDVKKHIIDTLRDFRIDINQALLDLGSGPILEASEDSAPLNYQQASATHMAPTMQPRETIRGAGQHFSASSETISGAGENNTSSTQLVDTMRGTGENFISSMQPSVM